MNQNPPDQVPWPPRSEGQRTWPCRVLGSPEANYVAICMLAGSELADVTFGLARRFPLHKHAPPHHIQWVSDIWTEMRRLRPPHYIEAEQLVSWLMAGDILRSGSWELGILVYNGWDVSAENLQMLERIRRELMEIDFNAAGVRAYLAQRSLMEGPQESRRFRASIGLMDQAMDGEEEELLTEDAPSEGSVTESQYRL